MNCPTCKAETRVVDSRETREGQRRRRLCGSCGHRFSTREVLLEALTEHEARLEATRALRRAHGELQAAQERLQGMLEALDRPLVAVPERTRRKRRRRPAERKIQRCPVCKALVWADEADAHQCAVGEEGEER